jgi:hypothetical protein
MLNKKDKTKDIQASCPTSELTLTPITTLLPNKNNAIKTINCLDDNIYFSLIVFPLSIFYLFIIALNILDITGIGKLNTLAIEKKKLMRNKIIYSLFCFLSCFFLTLRKSKIKIREYSTKIIKNNIITSFYLAKPVL